MSAKTELFLSLLIVAAVGVAVYAFVNGSLWAFVIAQMVLMPGIVLMTFIVLSRAEKRKREARFQKSDDEG